MSGGTFLVKPEHSVNRYGDQIGRSWRVVIEGEVADDWVVQSLYELIGKSAAVDTGHVCFIVAFADRR
jgi:hypothetical protein